MRLRRRSAGHGRRSILSAPSARHVSLDDSVGSAALDVDSMLLRFVATTPAADDGIRSSPTVKTAGLPPPSGLPPSGRVTSARRTYQRRRRRPPNDVNDSSIDTISSSFDDAQMTSSNVDLKDATAAAVTAVSTVSAEPGSTYSVDRSRPVRRSLRRRRRTDESPSPAAEQDAAPPVSTSTSAEPTDLTDVTKPEALWELCGEKLTDVCRRVLDVGVTDDVVAEATSPADDVAELVNAEVEVVVQSSHVSQQSPADDVPGLERRREKDDLNAYRISLIPEVIPATADQPTSRSSEPDLTDDNCDDAGNIQATDGGRSGIDVDDDDYDEFSEHIRPTSQTSVDSVETGETAVNHVPPVDGREDDEQLQTVTDSSEHCRDRVEPVEKVVSDQPRTVGVSSNVGEYHIVEADDVVSDHLNDEESSSAVEKRTNLPGLDLSIMLSPSIELQDIMDTIYTLTSGVNAENFTAEEEDGISSPPAGRDSTTVDDECCRLEIEDSWRQHRGDVEQSAAVCLEGSDDDSLLDLDAETYYFDLSPADVDFAESLHLAIGEDDDDLDIEDAEYDLDDDEIL